MPFPNPGNQMNVHEYVQMVSGALEKCDGESLGKLMSFRDPHVLSYRMRMERPDGIVAKQFYPPLDEAIAGHVRCCWAISNKNVIEAWRSQTVVVNAVARFMTESKEENWMLPVMNAVCLDLRMFALRADQELSMKGTSKPGETLEKAAETLMACFRVCAADTRASEDCTKRWGLMYLVNQFFKIYFKINKLNLCKPMIRAIESLSFKDEYPLSQLITYKYYTGRKSMFESDFKTANEALTFAFERCYKKNWKNKRRILIYLIPVKILIGFMPKERVLQKYNLKEFVDVVRGVRDGNVRQLRQAFMKHERFFIAAGIYLILEKLQSVAFRNLFKKVFLIKGSHQIDIPVFYQSLKWMLKDEIDIEETECILANMIFDGKIKGYISHEHQKVVLSKKDPFPSLASF